MGKAVRLFAFALLSISVSIASAFEGDDAEIRKADYVMDHSNSSITVGADGSSKWIIEEQFTSRTEVGRTELGLREITFEKDTSTVRVLSAYVGIQGLKIPSNLSKITERSESNDKTGLSDTRKLIIPFGKLQVGTSVGFTYELSMPKTTVPGVASFTFGYGMIHPEMGGEVKFSSVKPLKIHVAAEPGLFEIKRWMEDTTHRLSIKQLRPIYRKTGMAKMKIIPADYVPMVYVSTADTWGELIRPIAQKYEEKVVEPLPPEFQRVHTSASGITGDVARINHVMTEVGKLVSYSGDWTTRSKMFFPRGHAEVVKEGKGDCKDFATSTTAILRKLGYEANVAITRSGHPSSRTFRGLDFGKAVPTSDLFNHAITTVQLKDGKRLWLDPTRPLAYADGIWPEIAGAPAIILNGASNSLIKIPESDGKIARTTLQRTVEAANSRSGQWQGRLVLNDAAASTLLQIAKIGGHTKFEQVVPAYILGSAMTKDSKFVMPAHRLPSAVAPLEIPFELLGDAPTSTAQDGSTSLFVGSLPLFSMFMPSTDVSGIYIGPPTEFEVFTTFKGVKLEDEVMGDCVALSKWGDWYRRVETKGSDTVVSDLFRSRAQVVTISEVKSEEYGAFLSRLRSCAASATIDLKIPAGGDRRSSPIHRLKIAPESMQSAEDSFFASNEIDGSYADLKEMRVFEAAYLANPSANVRARAYRAKNLAILGYSHGDVYTAAYLDAALFELESLLKDHPNSAVAFRIRSSVLKMKGDYSSSLKDAITAYRLEPNEYFSRSAMAIGHLKAGNDVTAEQWMISAKSIAKKDHEVRSAWRDFQLLSEHRKDLPGRIRALAELQKLSPDSPWAAHNLAIALAENGELDKAIEIEKKALEKMKFGAAEHSLAEFLVRKVVRFKDSFPENSKDWSKSRENEKLLLEAYAIRPDSESVLYQLGLMYLDRMVAERESDWLDKADIYIKEGMRHHPSSEYMSYLHGTAISYKTKIMSDFKAQGRGVPSGRWPAEFQSSNQGQ